MITNLFSYGIAKYTLELEDNYIDTIIDYGNSNAIENGQTEGNLHTIELFEPLSSVFANAARAFAEELGFDPDIEFIITQMWFNCYVKNHTIQLHTHPNSIYSGVFYIGENLSHGTQFLKPAIGNQIDLKVKTMGEHTADSAIIQPEKNLLLMFPSYLQHQAIKNEQDINRYTMSFNCLPNKFGDENKLNYFAMP